MWREIRAWATINNTAFNIVYAGVPLPPKDDSTPGAAGQSQDVSSAWRAYHSVTADWQKGSRFQKQLPREAEYRHSLQEKSEALTAAAKVLEKLDEDNTTRELEPYVLFSLGDEGIAEDYIAYRAKNRVKLEDYMDRFVVPPAPARQYLTSARDW